MEKNFPGEQWKTIQIDLDYINDGRLEISNFGRVRTFNKISKGNILKGSMINGYRIIRLKLYKPREEKKVKYFHTLSQQSLKMARQVKLLSQDEENKQLAHEAAVLLEGFKKDLSKKFEKDLKSRIMNYHSLVHRLVADYFLTKPSAEHKVVSHKDHDKLNNKSTNLVWMTPAENAAHQQTSPHVIRRKQDSGSLLRPATKVNKLTITKVMLLKKMLNQGKPSKTLAKQFKVTETQILRIKKGENWGIVEAAK